MCVCVCVAREWILLHVNRLLRLSETAMLSTLDAQCVATGTGNDALKLGRIGRRSVGVRGDNQALHAMGGLGDDGMEGAISRTDQADMFVP